MREGDVRAGRAVVWLFCAVTAGVNVPNALVPQYASRYDLPPDGQALLLSIYMATLVGTLLLLARRPRPGGARRLLLAAGVVSILADTLIGLGALAFGFVLAGRVLAGLAMALGTSAAAGLALAHLGERGRTAIGTGTVLGSLAGNLGAGAVAAAGGAVLVTVPFVHAVLTGVVLAGAAVLVPGGDVLRGTARRGAVPGEWSGTSAGVREIPPAVVLPVYSPRQRVAGYIVGAASWLAAGLVLALVPAAVRQARPDSSPVEYMLPCAALLVTAWLAQRALAPRLHRVRAWAVSAGIVAGTTAVALSLTGGSLPLVTAACALLGLAQGPAYTLGMITVTNRLGPAEQATVTARYAAWAYSTCAAGVLVTGVLAARIGLPAGLCLVAVSAAVAGVVATGLAGRARSAEARALDELAVTALRPAG
ncbi:hypothetical protein KIH74_29915 [Kineosporia sp. J2-2]|uniref:MFS transporter n=1 Tax=Kineosporia corallincola TaxID=2835133 RepID=A0ABS5TQK7_9ACTN|nr:hypothetical protein [Kineosporia corallincola]MBT0773198.1 hypothetical protein [Kineosporia corallincola]